jgi:hypothetical protein
MTDGEGDIRAGGHLQTNILYTLYHLPKRSFAMSQQSTFQILHKHFNEPVCSRGFLVGLFIGIAAWFWGRSPLPALALKFASGFGGLLASVLGVVLVLAVTALLTKNRTRYLAYGYFQKVLPWVLGKLLRATSVFLGLIVAAAVCWGCTGSSNALKTVVYGMVLGSMLAYCWSGLVVISDDLAKRA